MMKRHDVEQGSKEWLELRYSYLTASQTPVVLGLSPYETPLGLFEEKVLREERKNNAGKEILFARGHNAEKAAREYFKEKLNIDFTPAVITNDKCPWILASLDGITQDGSTIFEAKFVGAEALKEISEGKIPPHHYAQVQAALLVSEAKVCKYFATSPTGDSVVQEIISDASYQEEIALQAARFMQDNVAKGIAPELTDKDYFIPEQDSRFDQLTQLKAQLEMAELKYEALKEELTKEYKQYARVRSGAVTIIRSTRVGAVEYKSIPELKGVDLEKYRKKPIEVVSVKVDLKARAKTEAA